MTIAVVSLIPGEHLPDHQQEAYNRCRPESMLTAAIGMVLAKVPEQEMSISANRAPEASVSRLD